MDSAAYTHGHHASVLQSHAARTAANSAGYLIDQLGHGMRLLDVGCGPGTITADLARIVGHGNVVALDPAPAARAAAAEATAGLGVTILDGDVMALPADDGTFDVVHAHQVLQHLADPVGALREMRRVTRPGGTVAVRDGDYGAFTWFPRLPELDEWMRLYHEITALDGHQADAGRQLLSWVLDAGFDPAGVTPSADVWCYATPDGRRWLAESWSQRALHSGFAERVIASGKGDASTLQAISDGWLAWGAAPDGWFAMLHGQVLATA